MQAGIKLESDEVQFVAGGVTLSGRRSRLIVSKSIYWLQILLGAKGTFLNNPWPCPVHRHLGVGCIPKLNMSCQVVETQHERAASLA
jgi:hypothetical protein